MTEAAALVDDKVQQMLDVLLQLASGDLEARVSTPEGDTPIDLVATAVNMLAEELAASITAERALRKDLEHEIARRQAELEELERAQAQVARQTKVIYELSTPVIEVWAGVLVLPLTGIIDETRGEQILTQLLASISRTRAKVAILDVTGCPVMDEASARRISKVGAAAKLLGTRAVLTGVSPDNAQTLAQLGVEFTQFETARSLAAGLKKALLFTSDYEPGPGQRR